MEADPPLRSQAADELDCGVNELAVLFDSAIDPTPEPSNVTAARSAEELVSRLHDLVRNDSEARDHAMRYFRLCDTDEIANMVRTGFALDVTLTDTPYSWGSIRKLPVNAEFGSTSSNSYMQLTPATGRKIRTTS